MEECIIVAAKVTNAGAIAGGGQPGFAENAVSASISFDATDGKRDIQRSNPPTISTSNHLNL